MNIDRLEEALDDWVRIGVKGPVYEAARLVLDAEEVWWCEEHGEPGLDDYDGCAVGWASYPVGEPADCRMVPARLLIGGDDARDR